MSEKSHARDLVRAAAARRSDRVGDTRKAVRLTGKKTYKLGTLRVVRDCGPLESC